MAERFAFVCERSGAVLLEGDPSLLGACEHAVVPCGGRVEAQHILRAVEKGAREVLVLACPLDNCRSRAGTEEAEKRVALANRLLKEAGSRARCHVLRAAANAPNDLRDQLRRLAEAACEEEAPAR